MMVISMYERNHMALSLTFENKMQMSLPVVAVKFIESLRIVLWKLDLYSNVFPLDMEIIKGIPLLFWFLKYCIYTGKSKQE